MAHLRSSHLISQQIYVCKVDVVHVSIYSGILQAKLLRNIACCVTNKEFVLGTESPTNRGFLSGECLANKVGCTPLGRDSRAKRLNASKDHFFSKGYSVSTSFITGLHCCKKP
jgi:hypothetical protein